MRILKQFGQLVVVAAVAAAGGQAITAVQGNAVLTLVVGAATVLLSLLAYAGMVRLTERRPVTEVARSGAPGAVGRGVLIGLAWCGLVIGTIAFLGHYRVDGVGSASGLVLQFGFMAAAAVTEEVMYRGVLLRVVEERLGSWIALALTSLVFGLSHLLNPNATLWGAFAIAVEAGGTLGAAYLATRKLWLPIGLHFGWNFALAGIFGAVVSGNGESQGLLNGVLSGPTLLSGGGFGPEASGFTVAGGVVVTIVFLWLAHRRGNLVAPRRRRRAAETTQAATLSR
ncbi:type II CAAX endopeptidase family protein [Kribbella karoonensis]|uniref:Type II CAAX endopeptidase family protein n=1 Tax=Kribbella karoonensis TaxID=324851 RepID=A0ABN2DQJ8_9ACTN|nr:type II CAAX endopeptidase family protein [Kribbella sp.]